MTPSTTGSDLHDQIPTAELAELPETAHGRHRRRPPVALRRPALYLAVAAAGALMVNVLTSGEPAARADAGQMQSVSIAKQLGVSAQTSTVRPLEQLVADRSQRQSETTAAAQAQAAANKAEQNRRAAAAAAAASSAAPAASGSFQSYAMSKVGGGLVSCLENLWGKESGWNPNAQNPGSTAYGIPQFLNSTWGTTGIPKTSDGYKQIDAGLIYIDRAYGSPCGAWSHSRSTGWY